MSYSNQFVIGDDDNDDSVDLLQDDAPYANNVNTTNSNINSNRRKPLNSKATNDGVSAFDPFSDQNKVDDFDDVFGSVNGNYRSLTPENPFDNSNRIPSDNVSDLFSDVDDTIVNDRDAAGGLQFNASLNDLAISQNRSGLRDIYNQLKDKFGLTNYNNVNLESRGADDPYDETMHDHRPPPEVVNTEKNIFDIRRCWSKRKNEDDKGPRVIYLNDPHKNSKSGFSLNHISTTK